VLLQFMEVLPMVLQHGSDAFTPKLLCSLLQTSSSVNQALRQTRARCSVDSHMQRALATPGGLSSFCVWLKGHSGLVSTLKLHTSYYSGDTGMLHNVLLLALHACIAAPVPVPGQAAALPLQLQSFRVQGYRLCPTLLAALAATQVQELELMTESKWMTPALCRVLGGLHSLHSLSINCDSLAWEQGRFQQLTAAVGQLALRSLPWTLRTQPACSTYPRPCRC
jgi:hypothetical protein